MHKTLARKSALTPTTKSDANFALRFAQRKMHTSINGNTTGRFSKRGNSTSSNGSSHSGSAAALRSNNTIVVGSLCAASIPVFGMMAKRYYFDCRTAKCSPVESSASPSNAKSTAEHVNDELNDHLKEKVMTVLRSIHLAFLFTPALIFAPLTYLESCPFGTRNFGTL